jgi:hypothetical protein
MNKNSHNIIIRENKKNKIVASVKNLVEIEQEAQK